jgi:hypothetical protein
MDKAFGAWKPFFDVQVCRVANGDRQYRCWCLCRWRPLSRSTKQCHAGSNLGRQVRCIKAKRVDQLAFQMPSPASDRDRRTVSQAVPTVGTMRYACCVSPRMYCPWNSGRMSVTCDPACVSPCPVDRASCAVSSFYSYKRVRCFLMGADGMDAVVSTLVPPTDSLNVLSIVAPSTTDDPVKLRLVATNITVDTDGAHCNERHGAMQHHPRSGFQSRRSPWPAIECFNRTPSERISFAGPDWWNTSTPVPPCTIAHQPLHQISRMPSFRAIISGDGEKLQLFHQLVQSHRDVRYLSSKECASSSVASPFGTICNALKVSSISHQPQFHSVSFDALASSAAPFSLHAMMQPRSKFGELIDLRSRSRCRTPNISITHSITVSLILCAGAIIHHTSGCFGGSCIDTVVLVTQGAIILFGMVTRSNAG